MWAVINTTPYAADRTWVQDKDGNKIWLVVVKATFDVLPNGSTRLAKEQLPPLQQGQHTGEPGQSSLTFESDLLGIKPTTDILLLGKAWAPGGTPAQVVDVQLSVGSIRKRLRVFGDRHWHQGPAGGLSISEPEPFESIELGYERAYGGWDRAADDPANHRFDARNPIGTGFVTHDDHCIGMRLPNIEYPDELITSCKDKPRPAGLSPIECHWSPRREMAGTYDQTWRRERFPLWADDFDARYHNCAPADQQTRSFLRGGEPVELINLTRGGRLAFRLPKVYPVFETRFGRDREEHRGELCTVTVESEPPKVVLAWQTSLVCNHRVDQLDATIVSEKRVL